MWCSRVCLGWSRVGRSSPEPKATSCFTPWLVFPKPKEAAHSVIRGGKETGGQGKLHWPWWGQWDGDCGTGVMTGDGYDWSGMFSGIWVPRPWSSMKVPRNLYWRLSLLLPLVKSLTPSHLPIGRAPPRMPSFPELNSITATKKFCGPPFPWCFPHSCEEPAEMGIGTLTLKN